MLENAISIVVVLVVGFLLYAQRNLRKCAKEDTDEATALERGNRENAMQLAVAGGYPDKGGGTDRLAMADGMTRAFMAKGHEPAEIFGLKQKSAKTVALHKRAKADRRLANWFLLAAISIAVGYAWFLFG